VTVTVLLLFERGTGAVYSSPTFLGPNETESVENGRGSTDCGCLGGGGNGVTVDEEATDETAFFLRKMARFNSEFLADKVDLVFLPVFETAVAEEAVLPTLCKDAVDGYGELL
jgi:hypothetical protein